MLTEKRLNPVHSRNMLYIKRRSILIPNLECRLQVALIAFILMVIKLARWGSWGGWAFYSDRWLLHHTHALLFLISGRVGTHVYVCQGTVGCVYRGVAGHLYSGRVNGWGVRKSRVHCYRWITLLVGVSPELLRAGATVGLPTCLSLYTSMPTHRHKAC